MDSEVIEEDIPAPIKHDRTEEVPALLGESVSTDQIESKPLPDEDRVENDVPPENLVDTENEENNETIATELFHDLPDDRQETDITIAEPESNRPEQNAAGVDLQNIIESLRDSLADTRYISTKIDAVSNDTENLIKQVNGLSINYQLLAAEMESISSGTDSKGILSKAFLAVSSAILALLVVFQIYMFVSLVSTQRQQNAAGASVVANISGLNKKMADYDKNITKALENQSQQEHAKPSPAAAEKHVQETHENKEVGNASVTPLAERLNKLRNGLPEKKLIRKETGDWFVYSKKNDECILDVEIIEALNLAYKKIGRSISTSIPLPSHKALCILKPDGKGGTQIVMTKEFLP